MDIRHWWRDVRGSLAWLSAAERLPLLEPESSDAGPSFRGLVRWYLSPETLPEQPTEDTERRSISSVARWLLAPERLPAVEDDTEGHGPGVVRWLLTSEPLPPPTGHATLSRNQEA
jgi:hypothetical protein